MALTESSQRFPQMSWKPPCRHFTVQKHAASRLHYDFRLQYAGIFKSWAIPDGPCLDWTERRLAILVDDHSLGAGLFEGTIPPGVYGAGTVMRWDFGECLVDGDMKRGLGEGLLKFELRGTKLKGGWCLKRISRRNAPQEQWWLIKDNDSEAKPLSEQDILISHPLSLEGRTMDEIATDPPPFVPRKKKPRRVQPSLFPLPPASWGRPTTQLAHAARPGQ